MGTAVHYNGKYYAAEGDVLNLAQEYESEKKWNSRTEKAGWSSLVSGLISGCTPYPGCCILGWAVATGLLAGSDHKAHTANKIVQSLKGQFDNMRPLESAAGRRIIEVSVLPTLPGMD